MSLAEVHDPRRVMGPTHVPHVLEAQMDTRGGHADAVCIACPRAQPNARVHAHDGFEVPFLRNPTLKCGAWKGPAALTLS
eukprot:2626068-Rhodomonas_salina.1